MAVYHMHATSLRTMGAAIGEPVERTFRGVRVSVGPAVVLAPSFAPCFTVLAAKLPRPEAISISTKSTLIVSGECVTIEQLKLDGALTIDVADGGELTIESLTVVNDGWAYAELDDAAQAEAEETAAIRGYVLHRTCEGRKLTVGPGESIIITNGKARRSSVTNVHTQKSLRRIERERRQDGANGSGGRGTSAGPSGIEIDIKGQREEGCLCCGMM